MSLQTHLFEYSIDGIHTEVPTRFRVKARSRREAMRKAKVRLKQIVKEATGAKWEWESKDGFDGPWYPAYSPGWFARGHLFYCGVEKPRRKIAFDKPIQWPVASPAAIEALAAVMAQPILQVIERAPVVASLFAEAPFDYTSTPTIPLRCVRQMDRRDWPRGQSIRAR